MNRAERVYEFRRVNMHGTKTGAHADPDYEQKYHPGGASTLHHGFGLEDGKHRIRIRSAKDYDPYLPYESRSGWLDVYVNPSESQLKRLSDPEATWDVEMRFMVDRRTGDLIAWEAKKAFHTQVTKALLNIPAWAANNNEDIDLWSDYTLPAGEFYDALRNLEGMGEFDQPDWSVDPKDRVVKPKILK
jgi:hypothetical protein